MTRWARNKSAQKHAKLPSDSTPWSELKVPIAKVGNLKMKLNVEKLKKFQKNSDTKLIKQSKKCHSSMIQGKVHKHKRVNSFVVVPLHSKEVADVKKETKKEDLKKGYENTKKPDSENYIKENLSEKQELTEKDKVAKKEDLKMGYEKTKKPGPINSVEENLSRKQELTEKEKLEKKEKCREMMIKKRNERGIQLLSKKVERKIYNMKRGMRKKKMSGDEIKEAVRKFRRREELRFRKESGMLCLRCRKPGHKVAECKEILNDHEQSMGVCFQCGSTEHKLSQCNASAQKNGELPFAKCFVCNGLGHLSSSCPKNPRGKYPKGGACKVCGSVNHFANQCPQDQRTITDEPTASLIIQGVSVDMDEVEDNKTITEKPRKTVISF